MTEVWVNAANDPAIAPGVATLGEPGTGASTNIYAQALTDKPLSPIPATFATNSPVAWDVKLRYTNAPWSSGIVLALENR